jgi:type VI secretion system protein ImpH
MAPATRRTNIPLADLLFEQPYDFDFFQAVRLLARMYPSRRMVGEDPEKEPEVVRFRAHQSMEFPASQIRSIEPPDSERSEAEMAVAFMGLTGPQGVLPWQYTEWLMQLDVEGNPALKDFLDLFNHRIISLFYRAWEKTHPFVAYERTRSSPSQHPDHFTQYLFDLIGMNSPEVRRRLRFPEEALLGYAGLMAHRPHSAISLRHILAAYFCVPVQLEEFVGRWFDLEESALTRLGESHAHSCLGVDAFIGDSVWNEQSRIRIRVGPMAFSRFREFLPNGKAFHSLVDWVQFFAGRTLEFDVEVVLNAKEVPSFTLSDDSEEPRLGWTSWLEGRDLSRDADDAVFSSNWDQKV